MKDFLATQLQGARRYDRIAGFFSSSLLEVAGEALERMAPVGGETCARVVCNSCLDPLDVRTARAAKWGLHREWCASLAGRNRRSLEEQADSFLEKLTANKAKSELAQNLAIKLAEDAKVHKNFTVPEYIRAAIRWVSKGE